MGGKGYVCKTVLVISLLLQSTLVGCVTNSGLNAPGVLHQTTVPLTDNVKNSNPPDPGTTTIFTEAFSTSPSVEESSTTPVDSNDHLFVSPENVTECLTESFILRYESSSGIVLYTSNGSSNSASSGFCQIEVTVPKGLVVKVHVLELTGECACGSNDDFNLYVIDGDDFAGIHHTTGCPDDENDGPYFTFTGVVEFWIEADLNLDCTMRVNFTAVPPSARPQIQVQFTSQNAGDITTPDWDGKKKYPHNMDSWVRVDVPEGHVVMISFRHMDVDNFINDCRNDMVTLYAGGNSSADKVWSACRAFYPNPAVLKTDEFFVHFISDESGRYTGFRLSFSFHNQSALPEKLPDGKWNCSVPYWADFRQHFLCNLNQECAGMEDEADCPYTTDVCGLGRISVGSGCYIFMRLEGSVTWDGASDACLLRGAHLVSLNTPEEWLAISQFLKTLKFHVFTGLRTVNPILPLLYQDTWQWADETIAYFYNIRSGYNSDCSIFRPDTVYVDGRVRLLMTGCSSSRQGNILCEVDSRRSRDFTRESEIHLEPHGTWTAGVSHVQCPSGHVTHEFLACDVKSACWKRGYGASAECLASLTPLPPSFTCADGVEHVPYTLVCDHRADCRDASDEDFCVYPPCAYIGQFQCGDQQCVPQDKRCDGMEHCANGADEKKCFLGRFSTRPVYRVLPPALADSDGRGDFTLTPLDSANSSCPATHFQCPGDGYCLPVFVRCNGVYDCPGKEDEAACDSYTCPGFYRCRDSRVCLHSDHLCDGVFQCPQQDDELLCEAECPVNCTCYGRAFFCVSNFTARNYTDLRYLDARGSGMSLWDVSENRMLVYLSLAQCGLTELDNIKLQNLHGLDLSDNHLTTISVDFLINFSRLEYLNIVGNPIKKLFTRTSSHEPFSLRVKTMDLSRVVMQEITPDLFKPFPELQSLNLSDAGVDYAVGNIFESLKQLRVLDLTGCPFTEFPRGVFNGLDQLDEVYADNYKLCCPATLPAGFNLPQCRAPTDEISSCDALLRSDVYRVYVSVLSALALTGNAASFVYRVFIKTSTACRGYSVFMTHLHVSDFLKGLYLALMAVADRMFYGSYLWNDLSWRNSAGCKVAGFLSLLSTEVSSFFLFLITVDRVLALYFPSTVIQFQRKSASVACGIVWVLGFILAIVPLFPVTPHWQFYGKTAICTPFPISHETFPGSGYNFAVVMVLNFVLFSLMAMGQVLIFWSTRSEITSVSNSTIKSKDRVVGNRFFTVVMSSFLCWFPIGLLGVLAANDVVIPGEVSVAMAIIVLPLNSALNPFLYTVNMILERRRQAMERRIEKRVLSKLQAKTTTTTSK